MSVATEITSAIPSTNHRMSWGANGARASAEDQLHLLAADEVLVAVFDLAPLDPLLVEPGPVAAAEVLDEELVAVAEDDGVLARDLAGVNDEVAVLAAADHEAVFRDAI